MVVKKVTQLKLTLTLIHQKTGNHYLMAKT